MARPSLYSERGERLKVTVPASVAGRVGSGTAASKLVATVLEDFFNQERRHQDQVRKAMDLKEQVQIADKGWREALGELRNLKVALSKSRQEYADLSRSLKASLRQASGATRADMLKLWHRVNKAEKKAGVDVQDVEAQMQAIRSAQVVA